MKHSHKSYFIALSVLVGSIAFTYFVPDLYKVIAAAPGIGSLIYALFQLLRDESMHQKEIEMKHREEVYNLSVTSHMASIAFDRHVAFCEEYVKEFIKIYDQILTNGTSAKINLDRLYEIRLNNCIWIPKNVFTELDEMETKIRKAGYYNRSIEKARDDTSRKDFIEKEHGALCEILGVGISENALDKTVLKLKDLIGASELSDLRIKAIKRATKCC